jgi:hypothetical protein
VNVIYIVADIIIGPVETGCLTGAETSYISQDPKFVDMFFWNGKMGRKRPSDIVHKGVCCTGKLQFNLAKGQHQFLGIGFPHPKLAESCRLRKKHTALYII